MRLIDANTLRNEIQGLFKAVYNHPYSEFNTGQANALSYVLRKIDESPEIPKYGHWTTKRTQEHDGEWYCDWCGYEPTVFENTPFCPSCGMRMVKRDEAD